MNDKKIIFISHITEEKEIAIAFKELIEESFLGMIEVFVSSDSQSIAMGQKWLDGITKSLKECSIEVILCSPKSIQRPWINFEAGAGWIRDISVIPLCHSGMIPSSLPMPLNLLQATTANEVSSLKLIFPVIANAIGAKTPKINFQDFIDKVNEFESKYTFWDECNIVFEKINIYNSDIIPALKSGKNIEFELSETEINHFSEFSEFLKNNELIEFKRLGGIRIRPTGTFYPCELNILSKFSLLLNDTNFKY
ncbi:toll/interleukin-1 receptor domain-containing protein [Sulfurimonas sp.]|uniref:toll/interleukin-1 receptor domain-containing protein n=1 Tax=Sulfurimonas sp. TaxID=2022749 RepID=UPI003561B8C9